MLQGHGFVHIRRRPAPLQPRAPPQPPSPPGHGPPLHLPPVPPQRHKTAPTAGRSRPARCNTGIQPRGAATRSSMRTSRPAARRAPPLLRHRHRPRPRAAALGPHRGRVACRRLRRRQVGARQGAGEGYPERVPGAVPQGSAPCRFACRRPAGRAGLLPNPNPGDGGGRQGQEAHRVMLLLMPRKSTRQKIWIHPQPLFGKYSALSPKACSHAWLGLDNMHRGDHEDM